MNSTATIIENPVSSRDYGSSKSIASAPGAAYDSKKIRIRGKFDKAGNGS